MSRALGILVPALGALALALTFLAIEAAAPDAARHERTLGALRAIVLTDAALQRDVLRARAGLLASYDPIVRSVDALNGAAEALHAAGANADGPTRAEIERRTAEVVEAVRAQETRVEAFKSQNAVLQNSLAYFGHLSAAATGPEASGLASAMLRFTGGPRAEPADVVAALDRLARSTNPDRRLLVAHGRLIVTNLPAADSLVAQILAAPISARADALQEAYLDVHGRATARADRFRMLLYAAALGLLIYLGYVFLRLRANARALRARVAFESLIAAISTDFIDRPAARIGAGIDAALARLGAETGAVRITIVLAGTAGVNRVHAWRRDAAAPSGLEPEDVLAIAGAPELPGDASRGWLHVRSAAALPGGPLKRQLVQAGIATWLCIPLGRTDDHPLGFLAFDFAGATPLPADDLALLRTAAEIFANAIARERGEIERDALRDRLAEAQRLESVGTLAGGIAHEFNNILGVILGAAEMAVPAATGPVALRLRQITTAAERAKGVVDQVLAFSRRRERQDRTLTVQPPVAEAVELLRASLPATLTLNVRLEAHGAAVTGDATEVQQVVMNLCTNAAHAMDERGTLEVTLDTVAISRERTLTHGALGRGAYVRLAVRDTGRGMDAATMERIFEPFFTTRPVGGGTGLGLSTVHGIVTHRGGALNVSSRPGHGSCFEAYWPQRMAPADVAEAPAVAASGGNGEAVLLVDDEAALVRMGEDMLAALGYEPVGFEAPGAALAAFRADPDRFDLALLDEVMPGMTGRELAAALHEIRPGLPIVLMTGRPGAVPADCLGAAREVLAKPLRSASLAEGLARHLPRPAT